MRFTVQEFKIDFKTEKRRGTITEPSKIASFL